MGFGGKSFRWSNGAVRRLRGAWAQSKRGAVRCGYRYERLSNRVVIPSLAVRSRPAMDDLDLVPSFVIEGQEVFLNPLAIQTVPRSALGPMVGSLADDDASTRIIRAIDLVVTRAYG